MNVLGTALDGVLVLEPKVLRDQRGYFLESYNRRGFGAATGRRLDFVQDNQSRSTKGVLRGLHYQIQQAQGKLIRVLHGSILDVAVDLRRSSETFGKFVSVELSADNFRQLWVPEGFAHGFLVLSERAEILYKTTDYYAPEHERCIAWDDPEIGIDWGLGQLGITEPQLSSKDRAGTPMSAADVFD